MSDLKHLLESNRIWAEGMTAQDPDFFRKLAQLQTPEYLWIGCSDSRVPANQITGLQPGEVFVHRNIANVVVHTDLNCLSVMQFAIDVLNVKHIIVCGHYGCGGVRGALFGTRVGLSDNWLRHIQDVAAKHRMLLDQISDSAAQVDKLCELNVLEQVINVCRTTIVRDAWERGQELTVHSWIYGLSDGRVRDLGISATQLSDLPALYSAALRKLAS